MEKSLLVLAVLALVVHTVQGDCDSGKADVCVAEQGGAPRERTNETDAQMCDFAITFLRCIYAACDSTPYPKVYQDAVDGLKKGMASSGIECVYPTAGAGGLQAWTLVIVLVTAVGLLVRG